MGLFAKKKPDFPKIDAVKYEPVLRCSICTGEQVLCIIDRETRDMKELLLITSPKLLAEICEFNGLDPESIRKIY